ncbi:hypothetical protein PLICRDRAFT_34496 [Plicaturopsis crispa FD-325 SS-3]|nr:hypothetical protein PLICRDRAFT_34496 [Plicaturopsis crispa FD-325 SS-3]
MSDITVSLVKSPAAAEIDTAVDLCLRAFDKTDVSTRTVVGNDDNLFDPFFRCAIKAGALVGELYLATDATGKAVGMALWVPPGEDLFSTEDQRQLGFYDFFNGLSVEARLWWKDTYLVEFPKLTDKALGPKGKLNSWYLQLIAVDPGFQRRGIATSLISAVRQKADGSVVSVTATTEVNVGVYHGIGFTTRASMIMDGPLGGFPVTVLAI